MKLVTDTLVIDTKARLRQLQIHLRAYPASVAAVSYASEPPPLAQLGTLLTSEELEQEQIADPVLLRFSRRLKKARPDLTLAQLLALDVPVGAGDQEVYTARLGKWLFEKRTLEG